MKRDEINGIVRLEFIQSGRHCRRIFHRAESVGIGGRMLIFLHASFRNSDYRLRVSDHRIAELVAKCNP